MKKKYNWTSSQVGLYGLLCFAIGIIITVAFFIYQPMDVTGTQTDHMELDYSLLNDTWVSKSGDITLILMPEQNIFGGYSPNRGIGTMTFTRNNWTLFDSLYYRFEYVKDEDCADWDEFYIVFDSPIEMWNGSGKHQRYWYEFSASLDFDKQDVLDIGHGSTFNKFYRRICDEKRNS